MLYSLIYVENNYETYLDKAVTLEEAIKKFETEVVELEAYDVDIVVSRGDSYRISFVDDTNYICIVKNPNKIQ